MYRLVLLLTLCAACGPGRQERLLVAQQSCVQFCDTRYTSCQVMCDGHPGEAAYAACPDYCAAENTTCARHCYAPPPIAAAPAPNPWPLIIQGAQDQGHQWRVEQGLRDLRMQQQFDEQRRQREQRPYRYP